MSSKTSAPASKSGPPATQAEVVLLPQLKNCLLNLPSSLVAVLLNANAIAQNVVVELAYRLPPTSAVESKKNASAQLRSVFLGWTGMQSQHRLAPIVGGDGVGNGRSSGAQDVATVEMDATFGRLLGLAEGQKVGISLHVDPPQAHTIHIEPLTATDWEIIELHARFLEMNFLSQVRALPNPAYASSGPSHPLTLHLTPTSTANIAVTSLLPAPPASQPFVKISPDAEVIVAPKTRQTASRSSARDTRSVASTSRKSVGGRSNTSTVRHKSTRDDHTTKHPVFLRAIDRSIKGQWFEDDTVPTGLEVSVDSSILLSKSLRGVTWVVVSIVSPAGLQEPTDPQKQAPATEKPTTKVVARLSAWSDAPDAHHAALSATLCDSLGYSEMVGGVIRIEAAPLQSPRTTSALKSASLPQAKEIVVKTVTVYPFSITSQESTGLKFGGESKSGKNEAARRIKEILGSNADRASLLDGPLTDGMVLPATLEGHSYPDWSGGILRFGPATATHTDTAQAAVHWLIGAGRNLDIEMHAEIAVPKQYEFFARERQPSSSGLDLVGIDALQSQIESHLAHASSVLLTGGLGSGKTSLAHALSDKLRKNYLFHVTYFACRNLVADETRVSTIKETLQRLFGTAAWGARLGGRALVVLDDLDKLCPVETELQVGGENGRSRQVSEIVCSVVRQYCFRDSGVVLLATAQAKESLNNIVIGGHVAREIVNLKAPSKDVRVQVLQRLVNGKTSPAQDLFTSSDHVETESHGHSRTWMDGSVSSRPNSPGVEKMGMGFLVDTSIDFLELAGKTDGYMPGDLALLVSRARSEALIRSVSPTQLTGPVDIGISQSVTLDTPDFTAALKGFTPASLRNVTLQSSTTTFSSIGGLRETRRILLETLQYPTTYAPIFAQCPLRLRSGLLLYGYPGCGKTLLASAVAGECGLNFISVKGPEILNKYIGASEKSVRDLFERAEAARPCVLFFDEFDSIAPKRG
ncbi:Peroxisome biosynthesis protein pex1, partial [Elasticomyces elasticus]